MRNHLVLTTLLLIVPALQAYSVSNDEIKLHPSSPPEQSPDLLRAKRQAYQIYVDGDVSVTVDKSGNAETGSWNNWALEKECSRTCGGGVQIEKRQCNGECTGPSLRYISCNVEPCESMTDFRAEQCSKFNDKDFDGQYYKWVPYSGRNKCELTCKPDTQKFFYQFDEKVVDGTKCDEHTNDICVEGICLPLGCDGKLGSSEKKDKCGVCGGDGSTCKTFEGFFDERNLSPGYHNIIILPVGATNIKIEEMRPTTNSLAIKNGTDHFYLNGNNRIQPAGTTVRAGGVPFKYETTKADGASYEKLTAAGPLTEELTIVLLFNRGNKDSAVDYAFSVPLEEDVEYMYKFNDWSACSVTCGKGAQKRVLYCIDTQNNNRVEDGLCDSVNATKPESEKACETVDCEPEWFLGDWEDCTESCGAGGVQFRVVYCHTVFANGRRITVDDGNCTAVSPRPDTKQNCNRFSCPEWQAGPWSACSEKCGDAKQYRSVTCRSEKETEEGKLLAADACDSEKSMVSERECNLGPCEGLNFVTSDWKLCQRCNDTEETRNVTCEDNNGKAYLLDKCLTANITTYPIDTRACATSQPCIYEWTSSQWSKCSTECGHGHQDRKVVCAISELGDITIVDEGLCGSEKPNGTQECTNEQQCKGTYFTGPWSNCTEECGGGSQSRMIVCLDYDKKPRPEWCDEAVKPEGEQECNVDKCKGCADSEFGCCNDNTTMSTGPDHLGCGEEEPLNLEEASGDGGDEVSELKASQPTLMGEEEVEGTTQPKLCNVTNLETNEVAEVPCEEEATDIDSSMETILESAQNKTIHCSSTEHKCCPDWYTPAEGPDFAGCPEFIQGACEDTKFGCCTDNVTLSRGPNMEGCGEPSCTASLFGCCKDRRTIAFGPHFQGCERSSFPCELSKFGCCADGITAALGKNGTGCGVKCLLTKYGCCPDGETTATGGNNEGCGCRFSKYGCCPNGKTESKGPNAEGCDSCATSQYGCCPDGTTTARGARNEGCPCQYTKFGCCKDGETASRGPNSEGCDNCHYSKYGCCQDSITIARGKNYEGCPATTVAPFIVGGTVAPEMIAGCSLPVDKGEFCGTGYKLMYYFDSEIGECNAFWFSGCKGNANKHVSKSQCEAVCVEPPHDGRCYLKKHEGNPNCKERVVRYAYDHTTGNCAAYWYSSCSGNSNNFEDWQACKSACGHVGPFKQQASAEVDEPEVLTQVEHQLVSETTPATFNGDIEEDARREQERADRERKYQEELKKYHEAVEQRKIENQQREAEHARLAAEAAAAPHQPHQPQPQPEQGRSENLAQAQQIGYVSLHPSQYINAPPKHVCRMSKSADTCPNAKEAWYFDIFTGRCRKFGSCDSTGNHFISEQVCVQKCRLFMNFNKRVDGISTKVDLGHNINVNHVSATSPPIKQNCLLGKQSGKCRGKFPSWYYDVAVSKCLSFSFSGCGGNANRYHTEAACEEACQPQQHLPEPHLTPNVEGGSVCEQPKDSKKCADNFEPKWYYNKEDGTCARFHWGGCTQSDNRFDTEAACKKVCAAHSNPCTLKSVAGPCGAKNEFYFFDKEDNQCKTFQYGGCLGNSNRFETLENCQKTCPSP
uniref:Papilin n=1 Tax=Rhabditophanes sp. KR3021 TaxID=114890 RepID=A0AC35TVW4_9BILA